MTRAAQEDAVTDKLVIDATVNLMVADRDQCLCCPGNHVYVYGLDLADYRGRWAHRDPNWLGVQADFLRAAFLERGYGLNGKHVRITLEFVEDESSREGMRGANQT